MVRFDTNKGSYVRMKLIEKMIDHLDIPSSIIHRVGSGTVLLHLIAVLIPVIFFVKFQIQKTINNFDMIW